MRRTQIQLPEALYAAVKRLAEAQQWSLSEVLRRGAEYMVQVHKGVGEDSEWKPPPARMLGPFSAPAQDWRLLAWERDDQQDEAP